HGAPLARFWVHNGFLKMGSDKMSKSLGNVVLPRDLLKKWWGEDLRFALLSAHYRQPLEWTEELLEQSKRQLDRFYRVLAEAPDVPAAKPPQSIILALDDDLNTPEAIAGLHELRDIAAQMEGEAKVRAIASLKAAGNLMGFFEQDPEVRLKRIITSRTNTGSVNVVQGGDTVVATGVLEVVPGLTEANIDALIAERAAARKAKNFARADEIRDDLAARGVIIEDGPQGATWRRG
ncbi:MAG TPA: hypothetical protein P5072_09500, partial [Parvularculaceae bacterium]|nr:hypothetical protein [Parvularculaceae bacterium]